MKGANTRKWTTLEPWMGLRGSGLKQYISLELCEKESMNNYEAY